MEEYRRQRDQQHERRKKALVDSGVQKELAELLPKDGKTELPQVLKEEIHRVRLARLKDEMKERETKARQAFENAWVKSTETDLFQCVRKLNTGMALDTTAFSDYMGLLSHKLMTHDANTGTKMCETAVAERRRACVRWGFIDDKFAHLITNLSDPVPWCTEEGECVESFTFRLRCLSKQIVFFFYYTEHAPSSEDEGGPMMSSEKEMGEPR